MMDTLWRAVSTVSRRPLPQERQAPLRHTPDDISVFDVWHISTVDMYFDISARILAYQWTFGISARILTYQPGFWHITRAPFRHLAYQKQQWEALRFDFVKHTGKRCLVPRR